MSGPPPPSSGGGGAPSPVARIEQLKQIEQDVVGILESAGQALQEMSKERLSQKQVDIHNQQASAVNIHIRGSL